MEFVFVWFIFAFIVAIVASRYGRSGFLWFLLSVIISPLLSLLFVLIAGPAAKPVLVAQDSDAGERVRCEQCFELIMPQAAVCKHCGNARTPQIQSDAPQEPKGSEAFGYAVAKLFREPMFWLAIAAVIVGVYFSDFIG